MALLGFAVVVINIWECTIGQKSLESRRASAVGQRGKDDRILVITTIFPYCDFMRRIAEDRVKLELVVPAGMDNHSFESTPTDMIAMQKVDVLTYNSSETKRWVEKVLGSLDTSHMKVLTMTDYVDVMEEEHVEGVEEEEEYCHEGGSEMHIEYDEHIWTSSVNVRAIVRIVNQTSPKAAPREESRFEDNTQAYLRELEELDSQL